MEAEYARAGEGHRRDPDAVAERRPRPARSRSNPISRTRRASFPKRCPSWSRRASSCEHSLVRAPATGQVVGLTVFTVGGVVAPGQKLMDIVPDGRELVIQAQLKPTDADDAYPGQTAQVRFMSIHNRSLPLFTGTVRTVSADSFTDEKTGRTYFRAEIVVPEKELNEVRSVLGHGELRPGLAGRGGADGAQAHRAAISAGAADRRAVALGPRGLRAGSYGLRLCLQWVES